MEAISLKKTTALVCLFAAGGFLVNANENRIETPEQAKLVSVSDQTLQQNFDDLLARYDANKDGLLNEAEISKATDKPLSEAFKKIDVNADKAISAEEFTQFVAQLNVK